MEPQPLTGADLMRMASAAGGDEELEELWNKALIIGMAKGYFGDEILAVTLEDIFAEDDYEEE
jgi:hypothetical protein